MQPEDVSAILTYINAHREDNKSFDVVITGSTHSMWKSQQIESISSLKKAGMTWWLESMYSVKNSYKKLLNRIRQGPPKI
jgi:hypothetical protein